MAGPLDSLSIPLSAFYFAQNERCRLDLLITMETVTYQWCLAKCDEDGITEWLVAVASALLLCHVHVAGNFLCT